MSIGPGVNGSLGGSLPVTILSGNQESGVLSCEGLILCGILLPLAFTGIALTFEACDTFGGTYVPVKSGTSGAALSYTVAANTFCAIDPKDFCGIQFLKIKSGSAEGADRVLICSLKGF